MTNAKLIKSLKKLKHFLSRPERWCKQTSARTIDCLPCSADSVNAEMFCLDGACQKLFIGQVEWNFVLNDTDDTEVEISDVKHGIDTPLPQLPDKCMYFDMVETLNEYAVSKGFTGLVQFNDSPRTHHKDIMNFITNLIRKIQRQVKTKGKK